MKNIYLYTTMICVLCFYSLKAQQTPANTQDETISIVGATAHIGDGTIIENATIVFDMV